MISRLTSVHITTIVIAATFFAGVAQGFPRRDCCIRSVPYGVRNEGISGPIW